jgi:RNA recognition motif-containing protein
MSGSPVLHRVRTRIKMMTSGIEMVLVVVLKHIGTVIYIANLSKRAVDKEVEDAFSRYGRIKQCIVVRDPISG